MERRKIRGMDLAAPDPLIPAATRTRWRRPRAGAALDAFACQAWRASDLIGAAPPPFSAGSGSRA